MGRDPSALAGRKYKCTELHGKDLRIMEGCWAKRNGWTGDPIDPFPFLTQARQWTDVTGPHFETVKVTVKGGSIGATFSGNKVKTVDEQLKGGLYQAMQDGYPKEWPGNTGVPVPNYDKNVPASFTGTFHCDTVPVQHCLPAYRRGATEGMIVKEVAGQPVRSKYDIEAAIAGAADGAELSVKLQVDVRAQIDRAFQGSSPDE
eukprot:gene6658-9671_t